MTATKACRDCSAQFTKSRQDTTVRCAACRKGRRGTAQTCGNCRGTRRVASRSAITGAVTYTACWVC